MFLIYLDDSKFAGMTESQRSGFGNAMLDYDEELTRSGHYIVSEPLKSPSEAITVRKWNGTVSTTDGPFMETKEYLSGFFIVEARDLNEAIQLASHMPLATVGSVEVRPLDILIRQDL
ncbi:YciI family protein [Devosia sp. XK-2]|uniref:YciI family protein n=2 Tax=Devosia sp. XK-2 TaxID=3126689 RepID=UPI0030D52C8B